MRCEQKFLGVLLCLYKYTPTLRMLTDACQYKYNLHLFICLCAFSFVVLNGTVQNKSQDTYYSSYMYCYLCV